MGELGYYSFDTEAPITAGTWQAIYSSAQVALTAQEHMRQGARSAFALCRPPGHHAGGDFMGGYCFSTMPPSPPRRSSTRVPGAWRSSMSTITMATAPRISSTAATMLFASIHGDPRVEYPYFLGYADERGEGAGEGCNHNYPLAHGSGWDPGRRRSTTPACGSPATPRMPW